MSLFTDASSTPIFKKVTFNASDAGGVAKQACKANPVLNYTELMESARETWETDVEDARAMIIELYDRLRKNQDRRDEIRSELLDNDRFIELAPYIEELLDTGNLMWIPALLRSTARRSLRRNGEQLQKRQEERLARLAAEKQAELEECQATPNFGLF